MERLSWGEIDAVFQRAADLTESGRETYLNAQDPEVAAEVRRLLASMSAAPDYARPAWGADGGGGAGGQTLGSGAAAWIMRRSCGGSWPSARSWPGSIIRISRG